MYVRSIDYMLYTFAVDQHQPHHDGLGKDPGSKMMDAVTDASCHGNSHRLGRHSVDTETTSHTSSLPRLGYIFVDLPMTTSSLLMSTAFIKSISQFVFATWAYMRPYDAPHSKTGSLRVIVVER